MSGTDERRVNQLVDFLHGKETQQDDVGAVARHVAAHVTSRPAVGKPARWPDLEALKTNTRWYGPNCTPAQVDAAIATSGVQ